MAHRWQVRHLAPNIRILELIENLRKTNKIATFAVGFGSEVDPAQLAIFAKAGGKPSPGAQTFYDAADQQGLDAALAAIAKQGLGCVYQLGQLPANLSSLYVFFDNREVQRDQTHVAGWDFAPSTRQVTFYGQTCQDLQAGKVKDIDIVYGCRKPTVEGPQPGGCESGPKVCKAPEDCPVLTQCSSGCCANVLQ